MGTSNTIAPPPPPDPQAPAQPVTTNCQVSIDPSTGHISILNCDAVEVPTAAASSSSQAGAASVASPGPEVTVTQTITPANHPPLVNPHPSVPTIDNQDSFHKAEPPDRDLAELAAGGGDSDAETWEDSLPSDSADDIGLLDSLLYPFDIDKIDALLTSPKPATQVPVVDPNSFHLSINGEGGDFGYVDYILAYEASVDLVVAHPIYSKKDLQRYPFYEFSLEELDADVETYAQTLNPQIVRYGEDGPYILRESIFTDACRANEQGTSYRFSENLARAVAMAADAPFDETFCRERVSGNIDKSSLDASTPLKLRTNLDLAKILVALEKIEEVQSELEFLNPELRELYQAIDLEEIESFRDALEAELEERNGALGHFMDEHPVYTMVLGALGLGLSAVTLTASLSYAGYVFAWAGSFYENRTATIARTVTRSLWLRNFINRLRIDPEFRAARWQALREIFRNIFRQDPPGGPPASGAPPGSSLSIQAQEAVRGLIGENDTNDAGANVDSEAAESSIVDDLAMPSGTLSTPILDPVITMTVDPNLTSRHQPDANRDIKPTTATLLPGLTSLPSPAGFPDFAKLDLTGMSRLIPRLQFFATPEGMVVPQFVPPEVTGPQQASRAAVNPRVDEIMGRAPANGAANATANKAPAEPPIKAGPVETPLGKSPTPELTTGRLVLGGLVLAAPVAAEIWFIHNNTPVETQTTVYGLFDLVQYTGIGLTKGSAAAYLPPYYLGRSLGEDLGDLAVDVLDSPENPLDEDAKQYIQNTSGPLGGGIAVGATYAAVKKGVVAAPEAAVVALTGLRLHDMTSSDRQDMEQIAEMQRTEDALQNRMAEVQPSQQKVAAQKALIEELNSIIQKDLCLTLNDYLDRKSPTRASLQHLLSALQNPKYQQAVRLAADNILASDIYLARQRHFEPLPIGLRNGSELLLSGAEGTVDGIANAGNAVMSLFEIDYSFSRDADFGSESERHENNTEELGDLLVQIENVLKAAAQQQMLLEQQSGPATTSPTYVSTIGR